MSSTRGRSSTKWLLRDPSPDAKVRLFCIPYSGCGASMYRQWPQFVGDIEICPVQLPGRENRLRESAHPTYQAMGDDLADALLPYLDRPYGLFGHCGSALGAYETAVRIAERGYPNPARVFVSSQLAPQDGPGGRFLEMTDAELLDELAKLTVKLGGTPVPSLLELQLGVLVGDIDANKLYHVAQPARLPGPLTAIGWTRDVEVLHTAMGGWPVCGDTTYELLDGEHYTFTEAPPSLLEVFAAGLAVPGDRAVPAVSAP
ncbi:thioesterase domain-containing protein [Catellatospora sp. KI3]|uniref:thioesterase II family protein n=1 Tax=Catellatospora sp. KI3 TaxID=3041620 RepID=UPI002482EE50|nr:thioesterase domain-containing protein [Catellatospora sp. KI3]MDI1460730.1 thioesterase domain-containing protein [Catellatospora sp. KI3]